MTNSECPDGSGPIKSTAKSCQGPSCNEVDRIGSGDLAVPPAHTHGMFGNVSLGYCCFKLSALLVTIAMLMPTFNTPSSVAVIFPSSDIPLPLITKTSALVDLSQTLTVHLKLP